MNAERTNDVAVTELFLWIYRFFYSKTVGLIIILAFTVLAFLGTIVTQAPGGVWGDEASREAFVSSMHEGYGGWTPILSALGVFHVFTSVPFYVVTVMLALSILACTAHRIPQLWRRAKHPRTHVSATFFQKARFRQEMLVSADLDAALSAASRVLRSGGYRVRSDAKEPSNALYADRNAWAGIGTVIAHLSFVMILAAFAISSTWGIEETVNVPVGGSVSVKSMPGVSVEALSFSDTYTEEGRPSDYVADLIVRKGQAVVAEGEVRVNSPLAFEGARFHQESFGVAADIAVVDADGKELYSGSVPLWARAQDGANAVGQIAIEDQDLEVVVATAASGRRDSAIPVGSASLEIYDLSSGNLRGSALVTQGDATEIDQLTVTFERERQYTGLRVRQDAGSPLMWAASILLVLGMVITFSFPYRRLWLRADPANGDDSATQIRIGSVAKADVSLGRALETLASKIADELESEDADD